MSLSLTLGSFFGLETGRVQGLQARGVQPNITRTIKIEILPSPLLSPCPRIEEGWAQIPPGVKLEGPRVEGNK